MKEAIVLAGSRGIGKGIADSLETLDIEVTRTSTEQLDTSQPLSVEKFIADNNSTDIFNNTYY